LSITLERLDSGVRATPSEVRLVPRDVSRPCVVAKAETGTTHAMLDPHDRVHRRRPQVVDHAPTDVMPVLQVARFGTGLADGIGSGPHPLVVAIGVRARA